MSDIPVIDLSVCFHNLYLNFLVYNLLLCRTFDLLFTVTELVYRTDMGSIPFGQF